MEQKQLDELDDSYFGEEFIDEETPKKAEIKIEKVSSKSKKKATRKKSAKKAASKATTPEPVVEIIHEDKVPKVDPVETKTAAQEVKKESVEDPWAQDDNEPGMFKEAGMWKVLSALLVILLLFSVFSDGFNFGETSGNELSLSEAESKALSFVNENLLVPPYTAQVVSSAQEDELFRVTLLVAGQEIDSYLTKDGNMFFPQGFDTTVPFENPIPTQEEFVVDETIVEEVPLETEDELLEEGEMSEEEPMVEAHEQVESDVELVEEPSVEEVLPEEEAFDPVVIDDTNDEEVVADEPDTEENVEEPVVEEPPTLTPVDVTLTAKKWLFAPHVVSVSQGQDVRFVIEPQDLSFDFKLVGYDIQQSIDGRTVIEFNADRAGEFEFLCSSCEEWRGMTGTLVVE